MEEIYKHSLFGPVPVIVKTPGLSVFVTVVEEVTAQVEARVKIEGPSGDISIDYVDEGVLVQARKNSGLFGKSGVSQSAKASDGGKVIQVGGSYHGPGQEGVNTTEEGVHLTLPAGSDLHIKRARNIRVMNENLLGKNRTYLCTGDLTFS